MLAPNHILAVDEDTPVERLLREQSRLQTPVADFSRLYDEHSKAAYRQLIPLENPAEGEQFSFEVDLDRCSGCKACVTACHSLNGLDEQEAWRDVGLIHGHGSSGYFQQTVTSACHHCVDPGCLNGCPVNAYEKDPLTGVVLHLDDQCIGCQYCVLKCPYDVPKYNDRLGIVRKCDMCHGRLAVGEAPACVQSCPTEAIRITTVKKDSVVQAARGGEAASFLPGAPHQKITVPTTRYVTSRQLPDSMQAADADALRPQHAHWPLIWMLVFTQVSVGLCLAIAYSGTSSLGLVLAAAAFGFAGLGASVLHLGRPLKAWRAFLGLTHSWLSREIFAFSGFAGVLTLACGAAFLAPEYAGKLWWASTVAGLGAVFTSVMIYHDTHRKLWALPLSSIRFYGTSMLAAGLGLVLLGNATVGWTTLLLALCIKMLGELHVLLHARDGRGSVYAKCALIQLEYVLPITLLRWLCPVLGLAMINSSTVVSLAGIVLLLGGEIAERYLFFVAVDSPKMPGGVHA